jgi:hypothetical protein
MANITYFFALAFSRTEEGGTRAEAAIRAFNEEHAISMAAHLEGEGRGAVALAKTGDPSNSAWNDVEILARFGDLPDDSVLSRKASEVWRAAPSYHAGAPASPIAKAAHAARALPSGWLNSMPFAVRREKIVPGGRKRSFAMTSLVALGLSVLGGAMLIITAKAGQRESRMVEMARPACNHTAITNEELRRLVRNEYNTGTDKQNTLRSVVVLCQANPRLL